MALLIAESYDEHTTSRAAHIVGKRYFDGAFCEDCSYSTTATATRYASGKRTNISNFEFLRWNLGGQKNEVYFATAIMRSGTGTDNQCLIFQDGNLGVVQIDMRVSGTGSLWFTRNGTQIGSTVLDLLILNTWYWLSIYIKIGSTDGRVQAYLDGNLIFDFTGNTQSTVNAWVNKVFWQQGTTAPVQWDDTIIMDPVGSAPFNGHLLAERRIVTVHPTADGYVSAWTATGAATDWGSVSETAYNDDTNYIASNTALQKSSFVLGDLPASVVTPEAVFPVIRARRDDTLGRNVRMFVRTGGIDYSDDVDSPLQTAPYNYICGKLHLVNPNTSAAWTAAQINGLEAGVEFRS